MLTLRAVSAIDQGGWTWVIDENGNFLRSRYGDAYQLADPEMFLANEILNDTMVSKRPNEAINWDLPPQNTAAPRPALNSKIKIKSSLPELNFLSHFKWSRIRTPLVVSILVGLTLVLLVVGKGLTSEPVKDTVSNEVSQVKDIEEAVALTVEVSELKVKSSIFTIDELILKGALASNFTTPPIALCEKTKCDYKIKVSNKENDLIFKITVQKNEIVKVIYSE